MIRSLNIKLAGSLLLIVIITVGMMIALINFINTYEFRQYVIRGNIAYTQLLTDNLGQYYIKNNGWNNVQEAIEYL